MLSQYLHKFGWIVFFSLSLCFSSAVAWAESPTQTTPQAVTETVHDLAQIREAGVLRHLGIFYANFVTGQGDGLDVELIRGFAEHLGVRYEFVPTGWKEAFGDLIGYHVERDGTQARRLEDTPIKGDLLANGMTILDWRRTIVDFSKPTFPSAIWLVARADAQMSPIEPTGVLSEDIDLVKTSMQDETILALENTCLDPGLYQIEETGAKVKLLGVERQLSEMVPAMLSGYANAEATLLDVPDALIALERWAGDIKIIGPVSGHQSMGVAFRKNTPELKVAFNQYFQEIWQNGTYLAWVKKYYPEVVRYYPKFFEAS